MNPSNEITFKQSHLHKFFSVLEKRQGKDGNGVYLIDDGIERKSILKMDKNDLFDEKINGRFLFHTRYATHGTKKIYNVQPLVNCRYVIAHNGSFTEYDMINPLFQTWKKYSDTHAILNLICQYGILKFYLGFYDKYFGVVVVYDKQTDMTYLLKSSGTFEAAKLEGTENYIYGSSNLNFWKIEETEDIKRGMYILSENGYKQLHKPKTRTTYYNKNYYDNYGYGSYYGYQNNRNPNTTTNTQSKTVKTNDPVPDEVIAYDGYKRERFYWRDSGFDWINLEALNKNLPPPRLDRYLPLQDDWDGEIEYYPKMEELSCYGTRGCNYNCKECSLDGSIADEISNSILDLFPPKPSPQDCPNFVCPGCTEDCENCAIGEQFYDEWLASQEDIIQRKVKRMKAINSKEKDKSKLKKWRGKRELKKLDEWQKENRRKLIEYKQWKKRQEQEDEIVEYLKIAADSDYYPCYRHLHCNPDKCAECSLPEKFEAEAPCFIDEECSGECGTCDLIDDFWKMVR